TCALPIFAGMSRQRWLRIKRINMTRPAVHEAENDALGTAREMGDRALGPIGGIAKQAAQGKKPKPGGGARQPLTAGEGGCDQVGSNRHSSTPCTNATAFRLPLPRTRGRGLG